MDFGQLLSGALANPGQRADQNDFSRILGTLGGLGAQAGGGRPDMTQALLSTVGSYVRSSLRDRRREAGDEAALDVVEAHAGTAPDPGAVDAVFPGGEQERVARSVAQETGIDMGMVRQFLPVIVPMVLKLLQGGASTQGRTGGLGSNPVLGAFLDADRDGDVDLGDAMGALGRMMGSRGGGAGGGGFF